MPELPDVAVFEVYLDSTALHDTIERFEIRDEDVVGGVAPQRLRDETKGRELAATRRHGKYLFVSLGQNNPALVFHFGMTGFLAYHSELDDAPDHARVVLHLDNGWHLSYDSQRKLGLVSLVDDIEAFLEEREQGVDALEDVDFERFREILASHAASAKSALMNQSRFAGIGNVYSDEILFQAQIHPKARVDELDERRLRELQRTMRGVLTTAIERQADPSRYPENYLTRQRALDEPRCPRCGTPLETLEISGRTAYLCPRCQDG
jgi:formamidopyrimidine-DNA glycosylase